MIKTAHNNNDLAFCRVLNIDLPDLVMLSPNDVPEPYRGLLVHDRDMTRTLEKFHGEPIHLRTLKKIREDEALYRQVLLLTETEKIVEFGAIHIHLEVFSREARERVLACYQPLGGILNEFGIDYRSRVHAYLKIKSDAFINPLLGLSDVHVLYGRSNRLVTGDGSTIAEVVEILPPA